jgi:hypothetical protein
MSLAGAHPHLVRSWDSAGGYIIVLSVAGLDELCELEWELIESGSVVTRFCEPDLGDELTSLAALATKAGGRRLRSLPLAGASLGDDGSHLDLPLQVVEGGES